MFAFSLSFSFSYLSSLISVSSDILHASLKIPMMLKTTLNFWPCLHFLTVGITGGTTMCSLGGARDQTQDLSDAQPAELLPQPFPFSSVNLTKSFLILRVFAESLSFVHSMLPWLHSRFSSQKERHFILMSGCQENTSQNSSWPVSICICSTAIKPPRRSFLVNFHISGTWIFPSP